MLGKSILSRVSENKGLVLASIASYFVLLAIAPHFTQKWDAYHWSLWINIIQKDGLSAAYNPGSPVNYLPLYLYVLKFYSVFVGPDTITQNLYLLKSFTLLFDISSIVVLYKLLPKEKQKLKFFFFALFNLAFLYNTIVWNQIDSIPSFWILLAFFLAIRKQPVLSILSCLIALNFKLQAFIAFPLLFLILTPQMNWKNFMLVLLLIPILEICILMPFLLAGNAGNILQIIKGSIDFYPYVSLNAFNFWHLILDGNLMLIEDSKLFLWGISFKSFGLIVFFALSSLFIVPYVIQVLNYLIKRKGNLQWKNIELSFLLILFSFFFFNTQMHERYIHPAIVFSTLYAFKSNKYLQWILLSLAYLLNLEYVCQFLQIDHQSLFIFSPRFISILYTLSFLILLKDWVQSSPFKRAN